MDSYQILHPGTGQRFVFQPVPCGRYVLYELVPSEPGDGSEALPLESDNAYTQAMIDSCRLDVGAFPV